MSFISLGVGIVGLIVSSIYLSKENKKDKKDQSKTRKYTCISALIASVLIIAWSVFRVLSKKTPCINFPPGMAAQKDNDDEYGQFIHMVNPRKMVKIH